MRLKILQCSTPPRAIRADERRRHLLDVARALFSDQGFHATGIAQIAAVSGIKVGQIYRDFEGKEDIVAAITQEDLATFLEDDRLTAAVDSGDFAAVRGWIDRFIDLDEPIEECRLMCEISAEAARNARIAQLHHCVDAKVRDSLMRALDVLAPGAGNAARRTALVDLIMTLGIGLIYRRIADPELDAPRLTRSMNRIIDHEILALVTPADADA